MLDNPIQFWLSFNNEAERLRLPVNPDRVFLSMTHGFEDIQISQLGEFTIIGKSRLREISFSSFFPRNYNPSYCEYRGFPSPSECVEVLRRWQISGKPIRLIITGTQINMPVTLRRFDAEVERGGAPGDVYYDIALKEYVFVIPRKVSETSQDRNLVSVLSVDDYGRPDTRSQQTSYTVKSGDTLWAIAQRTLGNGDRWRLLYDANKVLIGPNPNLIWSGQRLVIPRE